MVTALFFVIAMFFAPVAELIPTYATAAALIYVGILMMNCVREIEWTDPEIAVPAFYDCCDDALYLQHLLWHRAGPHLLHHCETGPCKIKDIKPATWIICNSVCTDLLPDALILQFKQNRAAPFGAARFALSTLLTYAIGRNGIERRLLFGNRYSDCDLFTYAVVPIADAIVTFSQKTPLGLSI